MSPKAAPEVCVLFDNLGPYHIARVNAAHALLSGVQALELFSDSAEYDWSRVGIELRFPCFQLFPGEPRNSFSWKSATIALNAFLQNRNVSVIVVPGWSNLQAVVAMSVAIRRGIPVVLMSESSAFDQKRHAFKEFLKRRYVKLCSTALCGGRTHRDYLQELGLPQNRIFLGYDAVDNEYFSRVNHDTAPKKLGSITPYFLASSRFIEKKNLARLIAAYADYRRQLTQSSGATERLWNLVLLGDGELRSDLEIQIRSAGIEKYVTMPGFKQYAELPAYYRNAEAFIHVSVSEQWGLVVNEAMASGLPVIVSERCGCRFELVDTDINGFLVDPFSVESITRAMVKMWQMSAEQRTAMGVESRRKIKDWGPQRFALGLQSAVNAAVSAPTRRSTVSDQLFLRLMGLVCA